MIVIGSCMHGWYKDIDVSSILIYTTTLVCMFSCVCVCIYQCICMLDVYKEVCRHRVFATYTYVDL